MAELRMSPTALRELEEALQWYSKRSALAASRFASAVDATLDVVEAKPLRYAALNGNYRHARVKGFPYYLAYPWLATMWRLPQCGMPREAIPSLVPTLRIAYSCTPKTYAHLCVYSSPGFRTQLVQPSTPCLLGESGKTCVSRQQALRWG